MVTGTVVVADTDGPSWGIAGARRTSLLVVIVLALTAVLIGGPWAYGSATAANDEIREAQQLLNDLGYPAGPVDGIDGPQTRRGLCTWRRLAGHDTNRGQLTRGELTQLRETTELPEAREGNGITVDKTCQAVYHRDDGRWKRVFAASTGSGGLPRADEYRINRRRGGWHTSTLYPASQPNMYNTQYFHGPIALHGSRHVPPRPVSAGCVRVVPAAADYLFEHLDVGDEVRVIGSF